MILFGEFCSNVCRINVIFKVYNECFFWVGNKECFCCGIGNYNFIMDCFEYDVNCYVCRYESFVDFFRNNCCMVKVKCVVSISFLIFDNFFIDVFE